MIFISLERRQSVVFFAALKPYSPFGDLMKKSATLISTALLTFGFAAASLAADMPTPATPSYADTGTPAPATKTKSTKHPKKHKKSTTAPAPTK
jgi:hypothetical protein